MGKSGLCVILLLVLGCQSGRKPAPAPKTARSERPEAMLPGAEDVLAHFLELNSAKYTTPPTTFRTGHVSPKSLPPGAIKQSKQGYSITLPSGAPVTTPAVYQGKLYVSGGFRSREFYALDAKTGKPAWGLGLDDDGPSSPACGEGRCVFGTESCTVFAVDSESGKLLWSWWLGDPLTSSPAIAKGRVFASYPAKAGADGKPVPPGASHVIGAFSLNTGKLLWQKWLDSDVMSAPVAAGDFVYVATFAGTLLKLYQSSGEFKYAISVRATSAPVVLRPGQGERETLFFTRRVDTQKSSDKPAEAEEAIVHMYDNGPKPKSTAAKKKAAYLDDSVQKGSNYAAEGKSNDSANGFSGGAPEAANTDVSSKHIGQSSVATLQAFQGSRVLHLGDTNLATMGDEVIATGVESGATLWSYKLPGDLRKEGGALGTSPLVAGKSVIVATLAGRILRFDPATGKVNGTYHVGGRVRAQPVVEDGWIYVGTESGTLVAIDTGDRSLKGWPMWGANAARTGITN